MISKELLKKYEMMTKEEFVKSDRFAPKELMEMRFYLAFLRHTDYLAIKLAEGLITREDKKAEFDARDFARKEINRLQK